MMVMASSAFAQAITGTITVRATDASGALIPGVEVTISSPAMISGSRSAVTDEQGSYRFTELVVGTYRVTFALAGFRTLNVDGNVVAAGKAITVPGVMEVSTVSSEVTVTSEAPTIDLEQATVGVNWDRNKLENLPYSRSMTGLTTMIPGLFQTSYDVGGSSYGTGPAPTVRTYGRSGNAVVAVDGLIWCQGQSDWNSFEEVNVVTAAKGADQMNAGVTVNRVLKSGGNEWHGGINQDYQRGGFQSNNVDQRLLDAGYAVGSNKFTLLRETYGDVSGPIRKDKLWFYFSYRDGYSGEFQPGFIRMSDGQQQEFFTKLQTPTAKLTYQLTNAQKIDTSWAVGRKWQPYRSGGAWTPAEASQNQDSWSDYGPNLKWTYIVNPRMTATAGINRGGYWWPDKAWTNICDTFSTCTDPNGVRRTDLTTASAGSLGPIQTVYRRPIRWTWNADASRFAAISGKNNEIKFGYYAWWDKGYTSNFGFPNQQQYRYRATAAQSSVRNPTAADFQARLVPANADSVIVYDFPNRVSSLGEYSAFYLNDKITWNRNLTINLGLRFERYTSQQPQQGNTGEGPFAASAVIPELGSDSFPIYTTLVPRLSFAYNLTGDGKFALKGSYGRYIDASSGPNSQPGPNASNVNPNASKSCTFNGWNGVIPFVPAVGLRPNSCSGGNWDVNTRKIVANAFTTRFGSLDLNGSYLDEYTAGVEMALSHDYSVRVNFVRKFDFPGTTTNNLAQPFSAYTDVRTATDPGPDGVRGNSDDTGKVLSAWSIPASFPTKGQNDNVISNLRSGEGKSQFTAYEVTLNKQYSNGWAALASYNIDMGHSNSIDPKTPNELLNRFDAPLWSQAIKLNGQYELPYGIRWAGTSSSQTGAWYNRTAQITTADNTTITFNVEPRVGRYDWVSLWDNRVSKVFKITERQSVEGIFDVFNTLNSNTITGWSNASGATYHRPSSILPPRIIRLGAKYRF